MLSSEMREHIMGAGGGAINEGRPKFYFRGWGEGMKRGKNNVVVLRKVNKCCVEPVFS